MKAILISIKPEWVAKILNGEKTVEIRKTCPEIFKHLKPYEGCSIDVYIYCTKDKETIAINPYGGYATIPNKYKNEYFNGKVVAKFTLNKVEEIKVEKALCVPKYTSNSMSETVLCRKSCLSIYDLDDYLQGKTGYAWHISNLVIFDEPKELYELHKPLGSYDCNHNCGGGCNMCWCEGWETRFHFECEIQKAPQSWCYVEVSL